MKYECSCKVVYDTLEERIECRRRHIAKLSAQLFSDGNCDICGEKKPDLFSYFGRMCCQECINESEAKP
jgi:hypothetical protein